MTAIPETPEPATTSMGYSLVLPPGWARIPLRQGTEAAVKEILDRSFASLPADAPRDRVVPYRRELERQLQILVSKARENAGLDLYLPVERLHGFSAPASFLVAEVSFSSVEEVDPGGVLAALIGEDAAMRPMTVDGMVGARTERVMAAEPHRKIENPSRRIDYIVPVPEDPDRWIIVSFSTLGAGDPTDDLSALLAELFDAIMTTFRWQREAGR